MAVIYVFSEINIMQLVLNGKIILFRYFNTLFSLTNRKFQTKIERQKFAYGAYTVDDEHRQIPIDLLFNRTTLSNSNHILCCGSTNHR